ncbi:diguanylate cyclase (GGDEF)-like protein [Rhizobium leguminosarum]|uniref:diguanylate cyclase n=2 Tax=Rhizobium/Agrobacterium group TaxID=227290 RepID=A0AAE2MQ28_RHILE|nr:diguanylate cyclase (GGDEF)-like protein [Rhizobium leguminosarum]MBB4435723.1 diguanylate cyclase (GGDEF)-like protein [Rhizobium esperanzae]MBB4300298.1 diguanylate cyclase (GGDEF)-like protein [Rhizobium leguminosarum]MBB4311569.1 diguanylate cyclase (GGDEF)-like protein [Rhizobium leguminosarum]MBB4532718.1 diguanylate cyclase (GGDEF)-like protein [Rhizobium leguminosarum]
MQAVNTVEITQQANSSLQHAWHLGCTGRSVEALTLAGEILVDAKARGDDWLAARCDTDIAWYCFQIGKAELGLTHVRRAVDFWKLHGEPRQEAYARAYFGWLLLELGLPEEAIEEATRALDLADKAADAKAQSLATNVIGIIFWYNKQPDRAILMSERSVELARSIGDKTYECWWLVNLGGAHSEGGYIAQALGKPEEGQRMLTRALELTEQALDLAIETGDRWAARICLGNNADYYSHLGEHEKALQCMDRYQLFQENSYVRDRQQYLYTLGQIYINYGKFADALSLLLEAMELIGEGGSFDSYIQIYFYLSQAHEGLGHFDLALEAHKKYHQAYLQNSAERTQQRARLAEIYYETKRLKEVAETESKRADTLEASYQKLQEETDILANAVYLDALTGLYNRKYLDSRFKELTAEKRPYSIAMLDVDHFKSVNDNFSHMIGDQVLSAIGTILRSQLRITDQAIRFGGEEFVVLLAGAPRGAADVCERLRSAVEQWDWSEICNGLRVTISIGVASTLSANSPDKILAIADQNLYTAKKTGRNRVVA